MRLDIIRGSVYYVCYPYAFLEDYMVVIETSLISEWNFDKNQPLGLNPSILTSGSKKKVWWVCSKKHEWEAIICNRAKGSKCPYCSGKYVILGETDFATLFPDLVQEWNDNRIKPYEVSGFSSKKVEWKCKRGHIWKATVANRTSNKSGCPYCKGSLVIPGETDLLFCNPELAKEFSSKNPFSSSEISYGSNKKVLWDGLCGHTWTDTVSHRKSGRGCPYCSSNKVLKGFNDLLTKNPKIASEWGMNNSLKPDEVTCDSHKKVEWICYKGHCWKTTVNARNRGDACPKCSQSGTSKMEYEIQTFIKSICDDTILNDRSILCGRELDIYIPSKKLAVEFNGLYWHSEIAGKDKYYHYNKWKSCKDKAIQLITIWEDDWRDKQAIVKKMISHKLGVSTQKRIYARNTVFSKISKEEAYGFLEENHIQGYRNMTKNYALKTDDGAIVAVMSFSTRNKEAFLDRYATSHIVVGGFSKMLYNSIDDFPQDIKRIVSFSDHEVSNGQLYDSNNFILDKSLDPEYKYVRKNVREHKFLYRLKRFQNDPSLKYEVGKTESELAKMNNLLKIWDSGKDRWVLNISEISDKRFNHS